MSTDKTFGLILLIASSVIFTYYTIWALFTPFLPNDSGILDYFPDREWAVRLPALAVCVLFASVGGTAGLVMVKSWRRKASKGKGKERMS